MEKESKDEKKKKAYHITEKSNLYTIQKNGLEPRIGRRSNSVDEDYKLVYFTDDLYSIFTWKNRLYNTQSFNDLVILSFDIPNNGYIRRHDNAGDCFISDSISPKNISLIQFSQKDKEQSENTLEMLEDIFLTKTRYKAIEIMRNNYEISEQPITELLLQKPILDSKAKEKIIEKLAEYEHKKRIEEYNSIAWRAKEQSDGSLEVFDEHIDARDIDEIQRHIALKYEDVDEYHKKNIRKTVMESFFIMQENNVVDNLGISDEELIFVLEETEHKRTNKWLEDMLNACLIIDNKYVIPNEIVQLWKEKICPYSELDEEQKEYAKQQVKNLFVQIEKYKAVKQNRTPLQEREDTLTKLERESEVLRDFIQFIETCQQNRD